MAPKFKVGDRVAMTFDSEREPLVVLYVANYDGVYEYGVGISTPAFSANEDELVSIALCPYCSDVRPMVRCDVGYACQGCGRC